MSLIITCDDRGRRRTRAFIGLVVRSACRSFGLPIPRLKAAVDDEPLKGRIGAAIRSGGGYDDHESDRDIFDGLVGHTYMHYVPIAGAYAEFRRDREIGRETQAAVTDGRACWRSLRCGAWSGGCHRRGERPG